MNRIFINPAGGISGDIFVAALLSAGAPEGIVIAGMEKAAEKLGKAKIQVIKTMDDSLQLDIRLDSNRPDLDSEEAYQILTGLYREFEIEPQYQDLGMRILSTLVHAEKKAHQNLSLFRQGGSPDMGDSSDPCSQSESVHSHSHLHEAQDIIIDIIGTVLGLESLEIEPHGYLLAPVSVGAGTISFSHGQFPVPAPATYVILMNHQIPWDKGPINHELCTPTGAAILAALACKMLPLPARINFCGHGKSRGSAILPIPPFELYLFKK